MLMARNHTSPYSQARASRLVALSAASTDNSVQATKQERGKAD